MLTDIERVSNVIRWQLLPAVSHDESDLSFEKWDQRSRHLGNALLGLQT